MSANYKDMLQKFTQKYKLMDPEYETFKSGPDHNPEYASIVTINDQSFKGQVCKTKKLSESAAALEVLNYFNFIVNHHNIKDEFSIMMINNKICILIDVDSLPTIDNEITLKELSNKNLDIFMFMNVTNNLINKQLPNKITEITVNDENSTSICIMMYTGILLTKNLYDTYFIVTNKEFADKLVNLIKSKSLGWNNKDAYQITKISEIYDILSNR